MYYNEHEHVCHAHVHRHYKLSLHNQGLGLVVEDRPTEFFMSDIIAQLCSILSRYSSTVHTCTVVSQKRALYRLSTFPTPPPSFVSISC